MDTRALCDGYSSAVYTAMRQDTMRTNAYANAIKCAVSIDSSCLDIGTGAEALLAQMCVCAGAKLVVGVECNAESLAAAKLVAPKVILVNGFATDLDFEDLYLDKVDIVIHEVLGEIASMEGVVAMFKHLLNLGGNFKSIPHRAVTYLSPARFPHPNYWNNLEHPVIVDPRASFLKLLGLTEDIRICNSQYSILEDLVFTSTSMARYPSISSSTHSFSVETDHEFAGLQLYMDVWVGENSQPEISTLLAASSSWATVLVCLPVPIDVSGGDVILVTSGFDVRTEIVSYWFDISVRHVNETITEVGLISVPKGTFS